MSYSSVTSKRLMPMWNFGGGIYRNSFNNENMRIQELSLSSVNGSSSVQHEFQDADYVIPCLSDELETMILSRFPISKQWKICSLNKKFFKLIKSGEIYKIRRVIGFKELSVFMLASGERSWCVFDGQFKAYKKLPIIPSDYKFECVGKESFTAGTHLFVSGMEMDGAVIWRYELTTNEWFKGPSMITPRCRFASASYGTLAYIAGGLETTNCIEVLNSSERYNSENKKWDPLPSMIKKRKSCAGFYMDNKFYVLGGQDENQNDLTCGEYFDEVTNTWNLIPNMLKDISILPTKLPPLIAICNNELYTLDACSNELKVYIKGRNLWKKLGNVPVKANNGYGVAFKSLGNELLVIGDTSSSQRDFMTIYTCCPCLDDDDDVQKLKWRQIVCGNASPFIHNCAVMLA